MDTQREGRSPLTEGHPHFFLLLATHQLPSSSAGNDDTSDDNYPAAYDGVIAVGATELEKTKAYYSSYGDWIAFVAPGGDVTVDENGDGYPDGVLQQTFEDPESGDYTSFVYYLWQGTSMAAPHVGRRYLSGPLTGGKKPFVVRG